MYGDAKIVEFSGRRSATYQDALATYSNAWRSDIACMARFLDPKRGEKVLEIGAGNGYFSVAIAELIGADGLLVATDPSVDQLSALEADAEHGNIRVVQATAEELDIDCRDFDAVWSRGAIHHVANKTAAFGRLSECVRPGGRMVIADIFAGTQLARYFDSVIARTCCTGHEVAFLSREFAESLCALTGWNTPSFHDVTTPWEFDRREDIGHFLHLLFSAKDGITPDECLDAADRFLSVTLTSSGWALMWPMTVMTTTRANFS
ncbi:class I SAM-dependent methyltransferase [Chelativorans xinjiangense]|uniref:class I SAM-dependent methyltransferase n=1 Tax=Chelativorans xinjiangense TaxID=2681485 RepID=UPI001358604F|nr:class I SAM-dependent methyltransferase [Chelativorans xinjiangense]